MPTSAALDVVAKNLNLKFFEVHYSSIDAFTYENTRQWLLGTQYLIYLLFKTRFPQVGSSLVI